MRNGKGKIPNLKIPNPKKIPNREISNFKGGPAGGRVQLKVASLR
jgi:hypothetical protein